MIVKTITFKNYLGEEETQDFYFNLSKGELTRMQMAAVDQRHESFTDKLEKIGTNLNGKALMEAVDEMIDMSYGVKTTDGKRFIKSPTDLEIFKSTGAYSELIVELCTSEKAMADFVNGLMPADLRDAVKKEVSEQTARERSQANLQGYNKKAEAPQSTVKVIQELPTIIENTAEPVLEDPDKAEFEAWKAQQKQAAAN
jgi:dsRNA-specific ribonuclease